MHEITSSAIVDAPAETVFEAVDDWTEGQRFIGGFEVVHATDERPRGLGARYGGRLVLVPPGVVSIAGEFEVVDHYYPERNVLRLAGDGHLGWTMGRVGDQTLAQLRLTFTLPGGRIGRIAGNALSLLMHRTLDSAVRHVARGVRGG